MIPFRTILVAADLSENSRQAFRVACSLAREEKSRIFVVHIVEPNTVPGEPDSSESLRERLREFYVPDRALDVDYQAIAEREVAGAILRMARELGCDLIAMGTHGRRGLDRLLTGSVAETVLRKAHCPVLTFRGPRRAREVEPIRVIVHPTDFSEGSEAALQVACRIASDHGARLVILHVAPPEILIDGTSAVAIDALVYRIPLEDVCERAPVRKLQHRPDHRLLRGDAAAEILRATREVEADLIVMGTHGRNGVVRLLMGSVAETVLRGADCPVLTVRVCLSPSEPAAHSSEDASKGAIALSKS